MISKIRGTGVALVTPFNKDESIDFESLSKLIEYQLSNGVNFIAALGTTSEAATLSENERKEVAYFIAEKVNNRVPVIVGMAGNSTKAVIDSFGSWDLSKFAAILSVVPFYNKPEQEGLKRHFTKIADSCPIPVVLYNVPSRTGVNMEWDTTVALSYHKNIIAVKEASRDLNQVSKIIRDKASDFIVLSGDDSTTLPMISLGGDGVISVAAQAVPEVFSTMVDLALDGDFVKARVNHLLMVDFIDSIFEEGNPAGVKSALNAVGLVDDVLRLPLISVSDQMAEIIKGNVLGLVPDIILK
ncbi:MAG: 4-hydroxy-tetrahydrodipicolinate synthase [Bacteroidales bacterium]|nr:4-hydroxy-tetrahydrodipicolinate synthase [Bacteroidales bacterium]